MIRTPVIVILSLAGASILLGGLSASWWTYENGDWSATIGLWESRLCNGGECNITALGSGQHPERWVRAGAASYAAALLSAGLIFAGVLTILLGRIRKLLLKTAVVASASAAASGLVFVWLVPEYPGMTLGYSAYLYFAGALVGTGASVAALQLGTTDDSQNDP